LRQERSENERIGSERRRLEGDVGRTGRSLQNRLSFNCPHGASAVIKLESDTEESTDGFTLINEIPGRVSTKRKSTRMDEEPPIESTSMQRKMLVNYNEQHG
jgi:hypothetical protein